MTLVRLLITTTVAFCLVSAVGCGVHFEHLPAGSFAGRDSAYDYSPSVIQSGNLLQLWWCGNDDNATDRTQLSDGIEYESVDLATHAQVGPFAVLGETQGAWDSVYTCNPKVVRGSFVNPLGNGATYTYAMYYAATDSLEGLNNSIGVAFSNNGTSWKKYPNPILSIAKKGVYGVGQPAVFNADGGSTIRLFYERIDPVNAHLEAISTDGVHFQTLGVLTTQGIDPNNPQPSWGDMAYDPATGSWYAGFNLPLRSTSTTGGFLERSQYGIQIYRIPDASLLTGATPWELVATIDTLLTGYEANFIPGFVRDAYGNLNFGSQPSVQIYTSISNPPPPWNSTPYQAGFSGHIDKWDISSVPWSRSQPLKGLNRYRNQAVHEVTTGWVDPNGGFVLESTLGHLYPTPQQQATVAFYGCKEGATDYFVSLDVNCEGSRILGVNGYGYSEPVAGLNLVPLYRCTTATDNFVSREATCEGSATGKLLGYALP